VEEFILDYYQTSIEPDEILTRIVIPDLPPQGVSKYVRVSARSVMEEPTVTVAARAVPNEDGALTELTLALGAVASHPFRVREAEALLTHEPFTDETMKEAASLAAAAAAPIDDMHGPAEWKRELVKVYVYRVLKGIKEKQGREVRS
jgi:carbon-monoxide dehydrogenase medium subunit